MSKTATWMPLFIGDYLADTMHLEAREHGAYLLLLMHYWRNGPLPDDDRALAGIARVDRKTWCSDTGPIVRAFFKPENGKLHQKRLDAERAEADEISAKKRDAAHKRWGADKKHKDSETDASGGAGGDAYASADAQKMDVQTACPYAGALQSQSPIPKQKEEDRSLRSLPHRSLAKADDFEAWWSGYPRKVGKDAARRAYAAAVKRGANPINLIDAVAHQRWADDPQFIPHPATWLNGGRWQDDPNAGAPSKVSGWDLLEQSLDQSSPTIDHEEPRYGLTH